VTNKEPVPCVTSENIQEGISWLRVVQVERLVPGKDENGAGSARVATIVIFSNISEGIVEGIQVAPIVAGEI
jgi:hypothetical protein